VGLRLDPLKVSYWVLVIGHMERKPTPNQDAAPVNANGTAVTFVKRQSHKRNPMVCPLGLAVSLPVCFWLACGFGRARLPETRVDLTARHPLVTVTNWRIIGPFKLPSDRQEYTERNLREAFDRDYLADIHCKESPLTLQRPTTSRTIMFDHDPNDEPDIGPDTVQFLDQTEAFPVPSVNTQVLYWKAGEFFKITYAAAALWSRRETDAVFIVSSNSPVKIWFDDKPLLESRASSVGHEPRILHLRPVHLHPGRNNLLIKLYCFPKRNEFAFRVATREAAIAFVADRGGLQDVVEEAIVAPGRPLTLSDNLGFLTPAVGGSRAIRIRDLDGNAVYDATGLPAWPLEVSTKDLKPGLYSISAQAGTGTFDEEFYVGDRSRLTAAFKQPCQHMTAGRGAILDPCATLAPLEEIEPKQSFAFRLDWQKRALLLVSQLEWAFRHRAEERLSPGAGRGTHVGDFRSRVDGQVQYYFFHLPKGYDGQRAVPLVIQVPHNTRQKPLLTGPVAYDPDWIHELSAFADDNGYACLWPHARGRNNNVQLAVTDTFEALADLESKFAIDPERIYLMGDCGGARNALLLAERFPDMFAGVSALNAATSSGLTANSEWQAANSPSTAPENLSNLPLQLIHGDLFPHSPTRQSLDFRADCRRFGMDPSLVILPGDARWADVDAFRISFKFLQGKRRGPPRAVSFATAQLKYGSSAWIRMTELSSPPDVGRINARFEAPNRIVADVANIGGFSILPDRLPVPLPAGTSLKMTVNGASREYPIASPAGGVEWRAGSALKNPRGSKSPSIEGPVSHAFAEPFVIVEPTGSDAAGRAVSLRLAQQVEKAWLDNYYVPCQRKLDSQVDARDLAAMNLVLVGTPDQNRVLSQLAPRLPFRFGPQGVTVGGQSLSGQVLIAGVFPNPANPNRYVVILASNGAIAADLPAPDLARYASFDLAAWRLDAGKKPDPIGEWYWDSTWTRLRASGPALTEAGRVEGN
jgi:dienelactone hydrolase